jgi:hypothetical protein
LIAARNAASSIEVARINARCFRPLDIALIRWFYETKPMYSKIHGYEWTFEHLPEPLMKPIASILCNGWSAGLLGPNVKEPNTDSANGSLRRQPRTHRIASDIQINVNLWPVFHGLGQGTSRTHGECTVFDDSPLGHSSVDAPTTRQIAPTFVRRRFWAKT